MDAFSDMGWVFGGGGGAGLDMALDHEIHSMNLVQSPCRFLKL